MENTSGAKEPPWIEDGEEFALPQKVEESFCFHQPHSGEVKKYSGVAGIKRKVSLSSGIPDPSGERWPRAGFLTSLGMSLSEFQTQATWN